MPARVSWVGLLFCLSVAFPLLGLLASPPETMLLLYTIFGAVYLLRDKAGRLYERMPGGKIRKTTVLFLSTGSLTEGLAWTNNYLKAAESPALFHPQLIPDLIIGFGFYGGWAVAWLLAFRWFRFTLREAFIVTGLQGIFFEQLGAVFQAMVSIFLENPLGALFMGLYVFAVHGSIVGIALAPVITNRDLDLRTAHWIKFPVVILLMIGLAFAGCVIVNHVADIFGGLPPKRSIVEHPLY